MTEREALDKCMKNTLIKKLPKDLKMKWVKRLKINSNLSLSRPNMTLQNDYNQISSPCAELAYVSGIDLSSVPKSIYLSTIYNKLSTPISIKKKIPVAFRKLTSLEINIERVADAGFSYGVIADWINDNL